MGFARTIGLWTCAAFVAAGSVAFAQSAIPLPQRGSAVEGRVVDAQGRPVADALLVARWLWEPYTAPGFHSGGGYSRTGEAIHVGEARSRRDGSFRIPGWGPKLHGAGRVAAGMPWVLAFKPGYAPGASEGVSGSATLTLEAAAATGEGQAAAIARLQQGPGPNLGWTFPEESGDGMPAMVLALHREKARLGSAGAAVLGAERLAGRSGRGELVVSPRTQPGPQVPVVLIEWSLRRSDDAPGTLRAWQAKRTGLQGSSGGFYVSPWQLPSVAPAGWELDPAAVPTVRAYAMEHRHSAPQPWNPSGGAIRLERLPAQRPALVAELQAMRADADAALGPAPDEQHLRQLRPLLVLLDMQCREATPDVRKGPCFEPSSPVTAFLERSRDLPGSSTESDSPPLIVRAAIAPGVMLQQASPQGLVAPPVARGQVSGFSIEPIAK